jgi:hypothetical protein
MDDPQKQLDAARQREAILRKAIHDIIKLAPAEAPVDDVEPFIEMKYADDGVRAAYRFTPRSSAPTPSAPTSNRPSLPPTPSRSEHVQ